MPEINLTNFEDGKDTELVADTIYSNFYAQNADSLAIINGELDNENISLLTDLTYKQIQDDAFSDGGQVGGTANLDYFSGSRSKWVISADYDSGSFTDYTMGPQPPGYGWFSGLRQLRTQPERWLAIPGACATINLPYDAYVLVVWSVTFTNDSQKDSKETDIAFILGDPAELTSLSSSAHIRRVRRTQFGSLLWDGVANLTYNPQADRVQDRYKSRVYSGHHFTPLLRAGRHDLGLYIAASEGTGIALKQSRVRARSLKYIYFRSGATF